MRGHGVRIYAKSAKRLAVVAKAAAAADAEARAPRGFPGPLLSTIAQQPSADAAPGGVDAAVSAAAVRLLMRAHTNTHTHELPCTSMVRSVRNTS